MDCLAQQDTTLARQIDSLAREDAYVRKLMQQAKEADAHTPMDGIIKELEAMDAANFAMLERILQEHGFPGKTLVGEASAHRFNELAYHANHHPKWQRKVLKAMKSS